MDKQMIGMKKPEHGTVGNPDQQKKPNFHSDLWYTFGTLYMIYYDRTLTKTFTSEHEQ